MKLNKNIISAVNSYQRKVERLKSISPEWKPISIREYLKSYRRKVNSI